MEVHGRYRPVVRRGTRTVRRRLYVQIVVPGMRRCAYRATFLGDISVPDNSPIAPNAPFNKIWSVRNDSNCAWGPGTALHSLVFMGGTSMNPQTRVELPYVVSRDKRSSCWCRSSSPSLPGTYRAEWKFKADTGELFGVGPGGQAALYVQIVVPNNAPCTYRATFLGDVTIPDNTLISPGQPFRKTWRLRNDGTCAWGPNAVVHSITNINNNSFGAPMVLAMPNVPPGGVVDLSIDMVGPNTSGVQRSEWMFMVNEGGLRGVGRAGRDAVVRANQRAGIALHQAQLAPERCTKLDFTSTLPPQSKTGGGVFLCLTAGAFWAYY